MDSAFQFSLPPAVSRLRPISAALYFTLPPVGLWTALAHRLPAGAAGWLFALLAVAAYAIYAVFAALLHKEFYPEKSWLALRLLVAPAVLSLLAFKFVDASFGGWLATTGLVCFLGVQFAAWLLFAGGDHWTPDIPAAGPGESAVRWRREGRSPWFDARQSAAARTLVGSFFLLPGLLTTLQLGRALFGCGGPNSHWNAVYGAIALLFAAGITAWLAMRQLVGMTNDGRIFGPGRSAFD